MNRRAIVALAGAALLAGCLLRGPGTLEDHMYAHFRQVGEIQTGVILGDLSRVRAPARWLAEHAEHPGLPGASDDATESLRRAARTVAATESLRTAAQATAAMAAACGTCHTESGTGPTMVRQSAPSEGGMLGEHMARHLWAADRLWDGLIGPSDELWMLGAEGLAESPFFLPTPGEIADEVLTLTNEVHEMGAEARRTTALQERVELYGRLLTTCSSCHALLGISGGAGALPSKQGPDL